MSRAVSSTQFVLVSKIESKASDKNYGQVGGILSEPTTFVLGQTQHHAH